MIALLLGCGRDPAAPPPGPSAALDPIGTPAPPTTLEVCDAGDDSFVARAAVLALGRRLRGTDELARWRAQARGQGREQMVRAMLAEPGAREAWATWLADAMHVARAGDQDLQDCWGRAALPGQGGALTSFLRASGPELAYPGGAFSMADVVADALAADDVSVVFRLHLLVRQVAPPPLPSEDPMVLETFYRTQLGLTFLSRYLDRDLSCIRCHNGEFSVTDTTWPLPGHAEQALFGDSAGPASEEALTSLFSHTDLVVDPAIEPDVPTVRPWGLDPSCGVFVDPSSWPDEPDWLGQEERYFVQELGPRGSVWDLERSLHAGVDGVRGAGPRIGPDGHMDGDEAFAWLVAVHLADQVWASAVGAPLTIANGFPRNAAQRDLLERLSSALVERWSLADLVVAVTAEPAFNPGMGCGADPYGLPALFDPWTDADLDPARRGNGPGDHVHPLPGRVVQRSVHDALEWPPPPEWILSPDAARLQFSIGTFVNDQRPSFVGHDLQTFLAFEDVYGPCAYPYGRELGWDFVDRVVAEAPAGSTLEGAAGRVRDRLLLDGHLADVERPWLEALAGVPSDTAAADVPDLEGALRAYCGALLLSPQYWLVTELAP